MKAGGGDGVDHPERVRAPRIARLDSGNPVAFADADDDLLDLTADADGENRNAPKADAISHRDATPATS